MTEDEANEKLGTMSEDDVQNLEGDELLEMVEAIYGEEEEDEEEEPQKLNMTLREGETREEGIARMSIKPEFLAAATLVQIGDSQYSNADYDINALIGELEKQTEQIRKQDMSTADAMLTSQAHMLDMLFYRLVRRAENNSSSGYLEAAGTYFKLALRAQTQCRTTWETAAKIKNPPVIVKQQHVKQQNVAQNQQVNNEAESQETEKAPSKLAEGDNELLPDKRNAGAAIPINPSVEALETVNRTANGTG